MTVTNTTTPTSQLDQELDALIPPRPSEWPSTSESPHVDWVARGLAANRLKDWSCSYYCWTEMALNARSETDRLLALQLATNALQNWRRSLTPQEPIRGPG